VEPGARPPARPAADREMKEGRLLQVRPCLAPGLGVPPPARSLAFARSSRRVFADHESPVAHALPVRAGGCLLAVLVDDRPASVMTIYFSPRCITNLMAAGREDLFSASRTFQLLPQPNPDFTVAIVNNAGACWAPGGSPITVVLRLRTFAAFAAASSTNRSPGSAGIVRVLLISPFFVMPTANAAAMEST